MSARGRAKRVRLERRSEGLAEREEPSSQFPAFDPPPEATGEMVSTQYSGPIPPPGMMAEFQLIDPTIPAGIMEMANAEQKHIHEERTRINKTVSKAILRPQIFAFILLLLMIGGGIWLVNDGKSLAGFAIMGPAAISALIHIMRHSPKK